MFDQLSLVVIQLLLKLKHPCGQGMQLPHVLEQDLAHHRHHSSLFENGDAVDDHVSFPDLLHLGQFRFPCFGHNMHPGVFNHFRHMTSDRILHLHLQKPGVGLIQHPDGSLRIRQHNAFVCAFKSGLNHFFGSLALLIGVEQLFIIAKPRIHSFHPLKPNGPPLKYNIFKGVGHFKKGDRFRQNERWEGLVPSISNVAN